GDPAAINTVLMCEAARSAGVKVLLSGMGADELFGGYRKHLAYTLTTGYRRIPAPMRTGLIVPAANRLPVAVGGRGIRTVRWAKRFLTFAELPEEEAFRRSYTLYDPDELADLVDPTLRTAVDGILAAHKATYDDNELPDAVSRMCLADTRMFMPGLNLTYTDRASMAASTEVRVPFVDPLVFEAAFSLPGKEKIRGRVQKAALKDVARQWLPDEIIDRPKASFGAPLRAWVTNDLRELVDDTLVGGELVSTGFLRREPLMRLIEDQRSGRRDESKQIWQLLSLELWYRNARAAGVGAG
ncbi:MAG: asparagine synthase-related protein, partial [Nocardioides sp.]